ncbi:MAG: recombinase XerC [Treponema sp.]|nr:MAG: recombinase XerC [Treponema sp.]
MNKHFEDYLNYVSGLKNYSGNTVTAYKNNLILFENWLLESELDVLNLTTGQIRIFVADLADKNFAPPSINQILSCIRGFFTFACRFRLCTDNPASSVHNIKVPNKLPNFMFHEDAMEFCQLPQKTDVLWEARDVAIFTALYSSGCRVSELATLAIEDFSNDYSYAVVFGKGKKERKVFFADFAKKHLKKYFLERNALLSKMQEKELKDKNGKKFNAAFVNQKGDPLTARGIQYIVDRYAKQPNGFKKISPHAFRHSFASTLLSRGTDIRVVQELLGHESISTTQRYTHISAEQLRNLYHQAHPHGGK